MYFNDLKDFKCKICGKDTDIIINMELNKNGRIVLIPYDKETDCFIYNNIQYDFAQILMHEDFVQYCDAMLTIKHKNSYHKYIAMIQASDIEIPILDIIENFSFYEEMYHVKSAAFKQSGLLFLSLKHKLNMLQFLYNSGNKMDMPINQISTNDIEHIIQSMLHDKQALQKYLILQ